MDKYTKLAIALDELCGHLQQAGADSFSREIAKIAAELRGKEFSPSRRAMLRRILSSEMRIGGKAIRELDMSGFSAEGDIVPWLNYLDSLIGLCEETI